MTETAAPAGARGVEPVARRVTQSDSGPGVVAPSWPGIFAGQRGNARDRGSVCHACQCRFVRDVSHRGRLVEGESDC